MCLCLFAVECLGILLLVLAFKFSIYSESSTYSYIMFIEYSISCYLSSISPFNTNFLLSRFSGYLLTSTSFYSNIKTETKPKNGNIQRLLLYYQNILLLSYYRFFLFCSINPPTFFCVFIFY